MKIHNINLFQLLKDCESGTPNGAIQFAIIIVECLTNISDNSFFET